MRVIVEVLILALAAIPALGGQYWITYEGNDFPEDEGWDRWAYDGGAQRSLVDGTLVLDGRASIDIADVYRMNIPSPPGQGQALTVQWRLLVSDVTGYSDPAVHVTFEPQGAVLLRFSESGFIAPSKATGSPPLSLVFSTTMCL